MILYAITLLKHDTKLFQNVNSQYTGGCLSCVSRETPGGQEAVLVYASGDNLCTLCILSALWDKIFTWNNGN